LRVSLPDDKVLRLASLLCVGGWMVLLLYELVEYSEKVRAVMRRGEESLFFMYARVQKQVLARVHLLGIPNR